jgi:hypothetical protein
MYTVPTDKSLRSKGHEVQICSAIAMAASEEIAPSAPYCAVGAGSAKVDDGAGGTGVAALGLAVVRVGTAAARGIGLRCGVGGTGVAALGLAVVRVGTAAARGIGLRCGVGALEAAAGDAVGARDVGVSGSGVMILTAGIELADGKSIREGAMAGLVGPLARGALIEPVVIGPLNPSCSAQLAEYRAT